MDASTGMLEFAKEKQVYSELRNLFLGKPEGLPEDLRGCFDVVTGTAILADGHLMSEVFDDMIQALKPGGIAVFTTRFENLEKYKYAEGLKLREDKGLWKKIDEDDFKKYHNITDGVEIGHFRAVNCKIFVYQKL